MSEPCLSSQSVELLLIAVIFSVVGVYLLGQAALLLLKAARKFSLIRLGQGLLDVSGGDRVTAETWIASARAENERFDAALRRYIRPRVRDGFPLWDDLF